MCLSGYRLDMRQISFANGLLMKNNHFLIDLAPYLGVQRQTLILSDHPPELCFVYWKRFFGIQRNGNAAFKTDLYARM